MLAAREPVVIEHLRRESRFIPERLPTEHGVISGVGVAIGVAERSFGVLGLYRRGSRVFRSDEVTSVQAVAGILSLDIERQRAERTQAELLAAAQVAQAMAEERTRELEQERTRRETFISAVAYELKNLMTPILATAQMMPPWQRLPKAMREEFLGAIASQTRRLAALVTDLMDVSRIEAGRFVLERRRVDLMEVVRRVVVEQQGMTERHRIVVEGPERVDGEWDGERLAQVLTNLVSNAVKYSPRGGEVRVEVRDDGREVRVCVEDQGVGMSEEELGVIFDPYRRLYRVQRVRGLGLGLYVSKGIVEAHGGRIWASSPGPDKGSTFCFSLPKHPTN